MVLTLTQHARDRLLQRGITADQVIYALSHRIGDLWPGQVGSIWVLGRTVGGRILKVCVATDDHDRVITAVWDST